jgi:hypothetical protein
MQASGISAGRVAGGASWQAACMVGHAKQVRQVLAASVSVWLTADGAAGNLHIAHGQGRYSQVQQAQHIPAAQRRRQGRRQAAAAAG